LCNDAVFETKDVDQPSSLRKVNGDATDTGLLRFAADLVPIENLRKMWVESGKLSFNGSKYF
jgi:sodium/potassium-transporting ATPase subunit alpha